MSELSNRRWAVISEHGCESSGLTYAEAHALMLRLANEKVHGLAIVTDEAARHFLREGSVSTRARQTANRRGQS